MAQVVVVEKRDKEENWEPYMSYMYYIYICVYIVYVYTYIYAQYHSANGKLYKSMTLYSLLTILKW